jgi:hypothetical protein
MKRTGTERDAPIAPTGAVRDIVIKAGQLRPEGRVNAALHTLVGLSIKTGRGARRIAKLITILRAEMKVVDDAYDGLIKAHGKLNEDGVSYSVDLNDPETKKAFSLAVEELVQDDVDIRFRPICMKDFGDITLPLSVVTDLEAFFDFEEDDFFPDEEESEPEEGSDGEAVEETEAG